MLDRVWLYQRTKHKSLATRCDVSCAMKSINSTHSCWIYVSPQQNYNFQAASIKEPSPTKLRRASNRSWTKPFLGRNIRRMYVSPPQNYHFLTSDFRKICAFIRFLFRVAMNFKFESGSGGVRSFYKLELETPLFLMRRQSCEWDAHDIPIGR